MEETLYSLAYGMYEARDYKNASGIFTKLCLQNPFDIRFWKGLASSEQMQKNYDAAVRAWANVALLGNHPPDAHFHAAECFVSMGELEEAKKALKLATLHLKKQDPIAVKIRGLKKEVFARG